MDPYEVRLAVEALMDALARLYTLRAHGLRVSDASIAHLSAWIADLATHEALVPTATFK